MLCHGGDVLCGGWYWKCRSEADGCVEWSSWKNRFYFIEFLTLSVEILGEELQENKQEDRPASCNGFRFFGPRSPSAAQILPVILLEMLANSMCVLFSNLMLNIYLLRFWRSRPNKEAVFRRLLRVIFFTTNFEHMKCNAGVELQIEQWNS